MATQLNLVSFSHCGQDSFSTVGYTNWKHALAKFQCHEKSSVHLEASLKWRSYTSERSLADQFSNMSSKQQCMNREGLLQLFSSLKFLARQGLATRGHTDNGSNYHQLLQLRAGESVALRSLINSDKHFKWVSHAVESEMLQLMANSVLRQLSEDVRNNGYFAVIVDETTDISTTEQVSICIRHVDDSINIYEDFLGVYATTKTDAGTLVTIIKDVLLRLNIPLSNMRAQCYDGASNMSGVNTGVQKRLRDIQPKAVYVHCRSHALNLALQEASCSVRCIRDILSLCNEVANFFRESAKRTGILESVISDISTDNSGHRLHPLCPTRWVVRARALNAMLMHYEAVIKALEDLGNEPGNTGAKADGLCSKLQSFETLLSLTMAHKVFSIVEQLATALQKQSMTLFETYESVNNVLLTLQAMRRDDNQFNTLWEDTNQFASNLGIDPPQMPRRRRPSRRIDDGGPAHEHRDCLTLYKVDTWYPLLDILIQQLNDRFCSDSFQQVLNAERLLIKAATGQTFADELKKFTTFYDDFDSAALEAQLRILHSVILREADSLHVDRPLTVKSIAEKLKTTAGAQTLLDTVWRLTKLLLVVPATSATAERSFSALRRLKTYIRSTIGQPRLNHMLVLHCHQERTDGIELKAVAQEFIAASAKRAPFFGRY